MASPRVKKNIFIVANFLFWMNGFGLLAYTFWIICSEYSQSESLNALLGSTQTFTYTLLGISAVLGAIGLCGCYGGIERSLVFLKIYMVFMVLVLLAEIGFAVFLHSTDEKMPNYISVFWSETNTETRNFIQRELKCCGFTGPDEYARFTSVDVSCYNESFGVTPAVFNQVGCRDGLMEWLRRSTPIWATVLAVIVFLELVALSLSCCVISSVEKQMRVNVDKTEDGRNQKAKERQDVDDEKHRETSDGATDNGTVKVARW